MLYRISDLMKLIPLENPIRRGVKPEVMTHLSLLGRREHTFRQVLEFLPNPSSFRWGDSDYEALANKGPRHSDAMVIATFSSIFHTAARGDTDGLIENDARYTCLFVNREP